MNSVRVGHIGLSVRNLEKSMDFYAKVFDAKLIFGPTRRIVSREGRMGSLCAEKLGPHFTSMRLAIMQIDSHHALEFFEFPETENTTPGAYGQFVKAPGLFMFSIHCPDLEATCQRVVEFGGHVQSHPLQLWPDKDWRIVYCTDLDNNTIELLSHSYTDMWLSSREGTQK